MGQQYQIQLFAEGESLFPSDESWKKHSMYYNVQESRIFDKIFGCGSAALGFIRVNPWLKILKLFFLIHKRVLSINRVSPTKAATTIRSPGRAVPGRRTGCRVEPFTSSR